MGIYIFLALCIISVFVFWKTRTYKIIYLRKFFLPLLCVAFILCLVMFSETAVTSAAKGINLWLHIVFPSLFPFFVASNLLNGTGFIRAVGVLLEPVMRPLFNVPGCASFAFAMGITSGYPVGAKITSEMRKDGLLTRAEAERLLTFSNNSGPLFIIGAVSVGMFNKPEIGIFLLLCHIAACITVGMLFKLYKREKAWRRSVRYNKQVISRFKRELFSERRNKINFGISLGNAIKDSVSLLLAIGGFIILFSVIINLLIETGIILRISAIISALLSPIGVNYDVVAPVVSGLFEITTGVNMTSIATGLSLSQQLAAASFILGWAGLSVHSQVLSIISETDISIAPYLSGKFLQGVFASIYTIIGIKTLGLFFMGTETVFAQFSAVQLHKWHEYFFSSCKYLGATLLLMIICSIISYMTMHKNSI
jgi:sporulation integral membrane protein YlbJ